MFCMYASRKAKACALIGKFCSAFKKYLKRVAVQDEDEDDEDEDEEYDDESEPVSEPEHGARGNSHVDRTDHELSDAVHSDFEGGDIQGKAHELTDQDLFGGSVGDHDSDTDTETSAAKPKPRAPRKRKKKPVGRKSGSSDLSSGGKRRSKKLKRSGSDASDMSLDPLEGKTSFTNNIQHTSQISY